MAPTNDTESSPPDQQSYFRRFLPYLIAFALIVFAETSYSYSRVFVSPYPSDALIIQTHGHNNEALSALNTAHIDGLTTIDTTTVRRASFGASLLGTTHLFAVVFIGFFGIVALLKRII